MKLTAEDLARLQTKEVANAIRKLQSGKTLTSGERALLAQASVGGELTAAGGFAATWDDLAKRLGVTRRAIQEWRRDPRYREHCPPDRPDGRHDVAAWGALMVRFGLKRADEKIESERLEDDEDPPAAIIQPPKVGGSQHDWKTANLALDHRKKQNDVLTHEGALLVAAELAVPLGATLAAVQSKLTQFPDTAARRVCGLSDEAECREALRDEVDALLTDINTADFIAEDAVAAIVAGLPFDEETTRLFRLVCFAEQDRPVLQQLIAAVATQALRQLGVRAITSTSQAGRQQETADRLESPRPAESSEPETTLAEPSTSRATPRPAAAESRPTSSPGQDSRKRKKKGRSCRQPLTGPADVEASIAEVPRRKSTKRRRK